MNSKDFLDFLDFLMKMAFSYRMHVGDLILKFLGPFSIIFQKNLLEIRDFRVVSDHKMRDFHIIFWALLRNFDFRWFSYLNSRFSPTFYPNLKALPSLCDAER